MQICPFCASENIFFSKKRNTFFCEDCEMGFETPLISKGMRIFLSYGHDKNAEVVKKIKEYLSEKGYDVWIDTSEIPAGKDWRERITSGLIGSNGVISFLSKHSVQNPGVCIDELKIAVCLKHAYIKTVLLEKEDEVDPPSMVRNTQWIDMSDWDSIKDSDWNDYFTQKMGLLSEALNSNEAVKFNEELEFLGKQLNVSNNTAKEQRLLKQTFIGRGWLMEKVDEWMESSSQEPFMIYGVPGAGKSAFAANLIQFKPDVLASMFFEWDHSEFRSADEVVKHLAFRLSATLPDYRRMLVSIYEDASEKKNLEQFHGAALFDYIILNPLQCCIDGNRSKGMIVFDGLDETTVEVADLLIHKASQMPGWIKVLFTSRHDETTVSRFEKSNIISLDQTQKHNYEDIREFLAYRLDMKEDSEEVKKLADKCEGSFMYAVAFSDAVNSGSMSVDDVDTVPSGLNNFYYTFFKRIFNTREEFLGVRPFFELLCVEDDMPEEAIAESLELDRYGLLELRMDVKSLVTGAESSCGLRKNEHSFKVIKLVHQSIKDWMVDSKKAGEFFIDVSAGYKRLARWAEIKASQEVKSVYTKGGKLLMEKIQSIDVKKITPEQLEKLKKEIQDIANDSEAERLENEQALEIKYYARDNYLKWVILGGEYDKAKEILIGTFDTERAKSNFSSRNYMEYYNYAELWQWADLFPLSYPIEELVEKLVEIVVFPINYVVSNYSHRSMQVSLFLMRSIMDSGRYAKALFALMERFQLAAYFTSRASDDGETRDGWDKYYMARDAAICLKKLDKIGVFVPPDVRAACEKMKLTYNFENGDLFGGMFYNGSDGYWKYGILSETELYKDICVLESAEGKVGLADILPLLIYYNTTALRFYLVTGDEEDFQYINNCVKNHADLKKACEEALLYLQDDNKRVLLKNISRRIEFIKQLQNTCL